MTREQADRLAKRDALVAAMSLAHIAQRARLRRGRVLLPLMGWNHASWGLRLRRPRAVRRRSN